MRFIAVLAAAIATSGCVAINATEAEVAPAREVIVPQQWQDAYDRYHYAPAVRAGDFVFLSGVVAGQRDGEATLEAGYDRAFRNVGSILEASGADWSDVVEITTYHTDLPAQFELFSQVKDRYVPAPYPAWTAIDVDRLLPDNGAVEIRIIAYAPRD